ncbi:hypothetical protein JTE90_023838 [Oedothorax gibbosus]|uniref:RNase H type-1 domain-containing protein n=1 Tax=Oedothorax gibbosus TaxID=931172 RepID=A0AAV6VK65_9ARAC|nr:hypothetical protein JTE90_023838 [Oedothorax gibbosus]
MTRIRACLRYEMSEVMLHTDSTIALAWLKTPANRLKTFIGNRVSKVQRLTEGCQWCHVPSTLNPADIISRVLEPAGLPNSYLWWNGPPFIREGKLSSGTPELPVETDSEYSRELKMTLGPDMPMTRTCKLDSIRTFFLKVDVL